MSFYSVMKNSITFTLVVVFILVLLFLIPLGMVKDLVKERMKRQNKAIEEVSLKWSNEQAVSGPMLTVPYYTMREVIDDNQNKQTVKVKEFLYILPDELNIKGNISTQKRYRGIYEVMVYESDLFIDGKLTVPQDMKEIKNQDDICWEEAYWSLRLSDTRGIKNQVKIEIDQQEFVFLPGIPEVSEIIKENNEKEFAGKYYYPSEEENLYENVNEMKEAFYQSLYHGIHVPYSSRKGAFYSFKINLQLNGSQCLTFLPFGDQTNVNIQSDWPHPSFDGYYLPEEREITPEGFKASWKVLNLNRGFPKILFNNFSVAVENVFGVKLAFPVDHYRKSMRSAKYGILIISLTFLVFFFVKVLNKINVHPIQYILVGLALCLFFVLLLSISEYLGFNLSYGLSALAVMLLIVFYSKAFLKSWKITCFNSGVQFFLFVFVYIIIQLDDYALLVGSITLFFILSTIMFFSRNIDWFQLDEDGK